MQPAVLHPQATRPPLFVFPDLDDLRRLPDEPAQVYADPPPLPDLLFGEADLARAVAAVRADAARTAAAQAEASLDAALRTATEALAGQLAAARAARLAETGLIKQAVERLFARFAAICLESLADRGLCEAMARAVERSLLDLPEGTSVTVEVPAELAPRMAALVEATAQGLPSLTVTVHGRVDLAAGDVLLFWQDGWAEWSFDHLRQLFAGHLGPDPAPPDPARSDPGPHLPSAPPAPAPVRQPAE